MHKCGHIVLIFCRSQKRKGGISMSLFIIATIVDRKNNRWDTLGYKVLNTKTGEYKLLSDTSIKKSKFEDRKCRVCRP